MEKEILGHIEKKKNEVLSEKETKEQISKKLAYEKDKEKLFAKLEKEKNLFFLKSLIDRGLMHVSTAEKVLSNLNTDAESIVSILEKIDAIEIIDPEGKIFPKNYRISKEEYIQALEDSDFRIQILQKIDESLLFIYESHRSGDDIGILNFFSTLMQIFDKNLVRIQEHTIDIKRSLKKD